MAKFVKAEEPAFILIHFFKCLFGVGDLHTPFFEMWQGSFKLRETESVVNISFQLLENHKKFKELPQVEKENPEFVNFDIIVIFTI